MFRSMHIIAGSGNLGCGKVMNGRYEREEGGVVRYVLSFHRPSSVVSYESLIECPIASRFIRCCVRERKYVCGGEGE